MAITNDLSEWDIKVPYLTFYFSKHIFPDKMTTLLGYYGTNDIFSEVYLMAFLYQNNSLLPKNIFYPREDLAKYHIFYDLPETYPQKGLHIDNAFLFKWDKILFIQQWVWDIHRIAAGINATYYLAPDIAFYWIRYMPHYYGISTYDLLWPPLGPLQEVWIVNVTTNKTGFLRLGDFQFAPYIPDLSLNITKHWNHYLINLTGNVWANLTWPHWNWSGYSPYPPKPLKYNFYLNGTLYDSGILSGPRYKDFSYSGYDWMNIKKCWNVSQGEVLLELIMPSMATLSKYTMYKISFSLANNMTIPPLFSNISMPSNFSPGENITIEFEIPESIINFTLEYSFDNGTTWNTAKKNGSGYIIPCQPKDELAIRINAIDTHNNSYQYISNPVALCRDVKIEVPEKIYGIEGEIKKISGRLTTIEGESLPFMAISLYDDNESIIATTDINGTFSFNYTVSFPADTTQKILTVAFPAIGLFKDHRYNITIYLGFTFHLTKGWNFITIPVDAGFTAKSLGENITGCATISRWNNSKGMFESYLPGISPDEDNFAIENGIGYFVYVNDNVTVNVTGLPITTVAVPLYVGWNTIGWFNAMPATAKSIGENISNCTTISRWNNSKGMFESYLPGISPDEDNFVVETGEGLFVYVKEGSIWTGGS